MTERSAKWLCAKPGQLLHGEYSLPGDKSLSHRMALLAALADGESCISNFLESGVSEAMLRALAALGVRWKLDGSQLTVFGKGFDGLRSPEKSIDCGNSATTLRLLAGALAAGNLPAVLDGSEGLRRRPMERIIIPLQRMGVKVSGSGGCAPLEFTPARLPLKALDYVMPVASAQVKSCLLLAALAADNPMVVREPGPFARPYRTLAQGHGRTGELLDRSSGEEQPVQYNTSLIPSAGRRLLPLDVSIPGDISSAAFLIVAALIVPGSEVSSSRNVGLNPTRTGLLDVLRAMGAEIEVLNSHADLANPGVTCSSAVPSCMEPQVSGELVVRMIDEFPALAAAAAFAKGETVISQAEELRYKESDRIAAICQEFNRLGIRISEKPDGFTIVGGELPKEARWMPTGTTAWRWRCAW